MKPKLLEVARFLLIAFGVVLLTSFTVDATDTLRESNTALSALVNKFNEKSCPIDMVQVNPAVGVSYCIDKFEAGVGEGCVFTSPLSADNTALNIADKNCKPVSQSGLLPWTYVSHNQAKQLCAKAGKRLPTAHEWYEAGLGVADSSDNCNLESQTVKAGQSTNCVSGVGAYDLVGNVWEYTDEMVFDGKLNGQNLPKEGYVSMADQSGIALATDLDSTNIYNQDYFWSLATGTYAIMRGGFYGSRSDGGIYAVHAATLPNFAGAAVGFRCALTL
jgi:hypothetical protein